VHGSFSDGTTNWERVAALLGNDLAVYAVHRRGRGRTPPSDGHSLDDEADDVAELVRAIGEPVFVLGHSYGAHVALAAAARVPTSIRKLVLYEPPSAQLIVGAKLAYLELLARADRWDELATTFFGECLTVPLAELEALRASELWPPIVADAPASLGDLRALHCYDFDPARFRALAVPVLLQVGTASPRELYVTDRLAAVLADARVAELAGQAHEGMTTAPELYAAQVRSFLLS
jgi:pimeloyl-ACP methyl ester carboxylesterase